MSEAESMNIDERRKYIHKMWGRYRQGKKGEKGKLLYEIEAVTGMHRKAIIRLLNGRLSRKKHSRERGMLYGVEVGGTTSTNAWGTAGWAGDPGKARKGQLICLEADAQKGGTQGIQTGLAATETTSE